MGKNKMGEKLMEIDYKKFVAVLSYQRSGSHFLTNCLDSHPDLKYVGEIFFRKKLENKEQLTKYLHKFNKIDETVCINIKYNHITPLIEELLRKIKVIHLIRKDIKKIHFSDLLHRFYNVKGTTEEKLLLYQKIAKSKRKLPKISFNQEGFNKYLKQIKEGRQKYGYLGGLTLYYENLTGNESIKTLPEEATRKICEFLEIKYHPLTTNKIKFSPTNTERYWK